MHKTTKFVPLIFHSRLASGLLIWVNRPCPNIDKTRIFFENRDNDESAPADAGEWLLTGGPSGQIGCARGGSASRASAQGRNDESIRIRVDLAAWLPVI